MGVGPPLDPDQRRFIRLQIKDDRDAGIPEASDFYWRTRQFWVRHNWSEDTALQAVFDEGGSYVERLKALWVARQLEGKSL